MIKGTTPGHCIFCDAAVIARNSQGLPTCGRCRTKIFYAEKCPICKSWLDEKTGKYGLYYVCIKHSNFSPLRLKMLGVGGEKKIE